MQRSLCKMNKAADGQECDRDKIPIHLSHKAMCRTLECKYGNPLSEKNRENLISNSDFKT